MRALISDKSFFGMYAPNLQYLDVPLRFWVDFGAAINSKDFARPNVQCMAHTVPKQSLSYKVGLRARRLPNVRFD